MTYNEIYLEIVKKESFLCVGLDTDLQKIPTHLLKVKYPAFEFNKAIVDATAPYTVVYKLNFAFYLAMGVNGVLQFIMTFDYIRRNYPGILIIADAKCADIGNTSDMYAKAFFETFNADAVTIPPYMGSDSAGPFLKVENKWSIILALTSNKGAEDFQFDLATEDGKRLFERVLIKAKDWGATPENSMFVIGATKAEWLADIRKIVPQHFLLIPGVGAQGGSLAEVAEYGMNAQCGLLVNNSRAIIYADNSERFAEVAGEKAAENQQAMAVLLNKKGVIV